MFPPPNYCRIRQFIGIALIQCYLFGECSSLSWPYIAARGRESSSSSNTRSSTRSRSAAVRHNLAANPCPGQHSSSIALLRDEGGKRFGEAAAAFQQQQQPQRQRQRQQRSTSYFSATARRTRATPLLLAAALPSSSSSSNVENTTTTTTTTRRRRRRRIPLSLPSFESIVIQYKRRVAADPNFLAKSMTEIFVAACTQFAAEVSRRGTDRIIPEIDFVVAGLLTAVAGKYYSMWRVAPTASVIAADAGITDPTEQGEGIDTTAARPSTERKQEQEQDQDETYSFGGVSVPTNAFQPYLLDGTTHPTLLQRFYALLLPVPSLFKAGFAASLFGYGLTALFIQLRTVFVPSYVAQTRNVNVWYASIFTGVYLATSSNIRYQLLQGIIEPRMIDRLFREYPKLRAIVTFAVRWGNGLIGSMLSIMGMTWLGLQQLKS